MSTLVVDTHDLFPYKALFITPILRHSNIQLLLCTLKCDRRLHVFNWKYFVRLIQFLAPNPLFCYDRIWLGLSDLDLETVSRTTDGFATSYMDWKLSTSPSGTNTQTEGEKDCIARHADGWRDTNCGNQYPYYCEGIIQ